jgi:hypothetical protein
VRNNYISSPVFIANADGLSAPLQVHTNAGLTNFFQVLADGTIRIGQGAFGANLNGNGRILIGNTTAPTGTPSSGGVLYVQSGALKFKGSSGTVTNIANA